MTSQNFPKEQNALLITAKGARMVVGKRHVPKPGPGEVLIRNITAALNPVDMYVQRGGDVADFAC